MSQQPDLFDQPTTLNILPDLKQAMSQAAKESGLSRDLIADEMNRQARRFGVSLRLGLATLEKWLNVNNHTHAPTLTALVIFCVVLGRSEPLEVLVRPLGCRVISGRAINLLRWAEVYWARRRAGREMRRLEEEMEE